MKRILLYSYRRKGKGTFVSREFRRRQCGIGLIVMSYSEMFPIVCQEISRLCQVNGHVLMLGQIAKGDAKSCANQARELADKFADHGVEGVIFQPVGFLPDADAVSANIVETFTRKGIPVVLVDGDIVPVPERSVCDTVEIDNFEAGYRLARHVLKLCPKGRIVYCTRPFGPYSNELRWLGVRSAAPKRPSRRSGTSLCLRRQPGGESRMKFGKTKTMRLRGQGTCRDFPIAVMGTFSV